MRLLFERDGLLDELARLTDVLNGSLARAGAIVLLLNVVVRFSEQLGGLIEARDPAEMRIEGRVIAETFAVIDNGLQFVDGGVHFRDRALLLIMKLARIRMLDIGTCGAQLA